MISKEKAEEDELASVKVKQQSLRGGALSQSMQSKAKTLFDEIGGMDVIKAVVAPLAEMLKADPKLAPFFQYTDSGLFARRLSHFYAHLSGGSEEWIGKPVDQAHQGRFI